MRRSNASARREKGSVLILVMWIAFGLVAIGLYFAHSMSTELQASDNRIATMEADQAVEGAALYVSNVLANLQTPNTLPNPINYMPAGQDGLGTKVGTGRFWIIGRDTNFVQSTAIPDHPFWGLIDEGSKVNINTALTNELVWLPQMTEDLAESIYGWRTNAGAQMDYYSTLPTPYTAKYTNYETIDELRMVYGMNLDFLYGEDANLNGIVDPNENDGDDLPPHDNKDGHLDSGILEYVTVWTHEGGMTSNGLTRVTVTNMTDVTELFSNSFPSFVTYLRTFQGASTGPGAGGGRGGGGGGGGTTAAAPPTSVLDFYYRANQAGMSESDFQQVEPLLMNPKTNGLLNINTCTATALTCVLGDTNIAAQILNYRQSNPPTSPSVAWVKDALGGDTTTLDKIGPLITCYTFQYTADIVGVGHNGRGYRRVRFVFDTSSGVPQIIYRQDLTHLGWALGKNLYDQLHPNT